VLYQRQRGLVRHKLCVKLGPSSQSSARQIIANGLTENDGHEIGGQDIYRLKIDYLYNAVCNSFQNNGRIQVTAAR